MTIYDAFMQPFEKNGLALKRQQLVSRGTGNVLELGVGTGANLPFYSWHNIQLLRLSDKEDLGLIRSRIMPKIIKMNKIDQIELLYTDATNIPLPDKSIDTVVSTLLFCSVEDVAKGLAEIKRILKPTGQLLFIEHVLSKKPILKSAMTMATPLWKNIASGCCLDRDFINALKASGFKITYESEFWGDVFVAGIARPIQ